MGQRRAHPPHVSAALGVEDSFKFVKDAWSWEQVQLLDLEGIRTRVALGWGAAGFLYALGADLEWLEVQLLAKLGGWVPCNDRPPGEKVLRWGLGRLSDMLITWAVLQSSIAGHGTLLPRIAALLGLSNLRPRLGVCPCDRVNLWGHRRGESKGEQRGDVERLTCLPALPSDFFCGLAWLALAYWEALPPSERGFDRAEREFQQRWPL